MRSGGACARSWTGPDLGASEQLARTPGRLARAGEVDAQVQAWVGGRSIEDCVAALNDEIPCGPIVRIDGYPREANLEHRGMICRLRDPVSGGEVVLPGSPLCMSASGGRAPQRVPAPDADREEVRRLAAEKRSPAAPRGAAQPPKRAARRHPHRRDRPLHDGAAAARAAGKPRRGGDQDRAAGRRGDARLAAGAARAGLFLHVYELGQDEPRARPAQGCGYGRARAS